MNQEIAISVKNKIAETDFSEVVSFNSIYRLKFSFDEEWDDFPFRVAVVMWAGGVAEKLFTGTECEMPQVCSLSADTVLVGVYSKFGEKRIASSFVNLRCEAGAGGYPQPRPSASLHEQVLSFLNQKDWDIFADKVAEGIYSAVRVNKKGLVTEGMKIVEVGEDSVETPSEELAPGGIFFRLKNGVYTPCYYDGSALRELALSASGSGGTAGKLEHSLTIGDSSFDGSEDVTVELGGLARKDTVENSDLAVGCVGTSELAVNAVQGVHIAEGAVGTAKLAEKSVTGAKLADGAVKAGKNISVTRDSDNGFVVSATVSSSEGGVTSVNGKTGDVTLSTEDFGLGALARKDTVENSDLAVGCVGTSEIAADSVAGVHIMAGAIGTEKLAANAVTGAKVSENLVKAGEHIKVTRDGESNFVVGSDSAVFSVNGETGDVVLDQDKLGLADVAYSGNYHDLVGAPDTGVFSVNGQTGAVWIDKDTLGLADIALTGSYHDLVDAPESGVLSVNGQTGAVTLTGDSLGLAKVATSGSYKDLKDKPSASGVTSVNGKTGAVKLTANDLGLGALASKDTVENSDLEVGCVGTSEIAADSIAGVHLMENAVGTAKIANKAVTGAKLADGAVKAGTNISVTRDSDSAFVISSTAVGGALPDNVITNSSEAENGADLNDLLCGVYSVVGTSSKPCTHTPVSLDNTSGSDCYWILIAIPTANRSRCVQLAFSGREDGVGRIRYLNGGVWSAWTSIAA